MEKKDAGSGIPQIPSLKYIGGSQGLRDGRFAVIGEGFQLKNYLSSVNYWLTTSKLTTENEKNQTLRDHSSIGARGNLHGCC
jgi:hypothetical protein